LTCSASGVRWPLIGSWRDYFGWASLPRYLGTEGRLRDGAANQGLAHNEGYDLTMRSVSDSGDKEDDSKNLVVLEKLQEAAAFSSDDFFVYTIGEPIADLDAAPYGGARFPVEARLDGRIFVRFHLDVGIGDAVMEPLEVIEGRDWLGFAGIASPSLYMILPSSSLPKNFTPTRCRDGAQQIPALETW